MFGLSDVEFLTGHQLRDRILGAVDARTGEWFTYANVDTLNQVHAESIDAEAGEAEPFGELLLRRFTVWCDGFGVLAGARILGLDVERDQRLTMPDLFDELLDALNERSARLYILGHDPATLEAALNGLSRSHPQIVLSGANGYFDAVGEAAIVNEIKRFAPDLLYLGMGQPRQERFLERNGDQLNVGLALCVGAVLDYQYGEIRRAPQWFSDRGLEWTFRLIAEPKRLWRRYLIGLPAFFGRVARQRFRLQLGRHHDDCESS